MDRWVTCQIQIPMFKFTCMVIQFSNGNRGAKNISLSGNLASEENFLGSHFMLCKMSLLSSGAEKVLWIFQTNQLIQKRAKLSFTDSTQ